MVQVKNHEVKVEKRRKNRKGKERKRKNREEFKAPMRRPFPTLDTALLPERKSRPQPAKEQLDELDKEMDEYNAIFKTTQSSDKSPLNKAPQSDEDFDGFDFSF